MRRLEKQALSEIVQTRRLRLAGHVLAPFAITINSNVCPHIRVLNTLMRESYA